jgi:hypothetical protein
MRVRDMFGILIKCTGLILQHIDCIEGVSWLAAKLSFE